jgi:nucleoside-diphosphate-sugar epimerase
VVDGLVATLKAPNIEGSTVELGSGELVPVRNVVERIHRLVDPDVALEFGTLADRPMERVRAADVAATAEHLNWRPSTSLDEGLRRTVDWYAATTVSPR